MNVIERAILLSKSDTITMSVLPNTFQGGLSASSGLLDLKSFDLSSWKNKSLADVKEEILSLVEKTYIEMVLERTRGRVGEAAEIAGIHPRGLYGKMKKMGLDKKRFKPSKD